MFEEYRRTAFELYNEARTHFCQHYQQIIDLEHYMADTLEQIIREHQEEIIADYNEASYLYPFWQNYPPDERGRQPVGDQFPWIEVGEHAIGSKIGRFLAERFTVADCGIPTGPDQRYILSNDDIAKKTDGFSNSLWLFSDIKSVGPRDDAFHAVMSHNQISGSGNWTSMREGLVNNVVTATGQRASHPFHCSIPPLYILHDGRRVPVINVVIKPLYSMLPTGGTTGGGQPLNKITLATIPNGLLLEEGPRYLSQYPSLFFPGKDDKGMNPLKLRVRVDFAILQRIAAWRIKEIPMPFTQG